MSDLQPVRSRSSLIDRHLSGLTTLLVLAIVVAIVKPWDWFPTGGAVPRSSPRPTASTAVAATSPPHLGFEDLVYDPTIFGVHEPRAAWGLWPAAYLVTFGFVFQISDPGATGSPAPLPPTGPTPAASLLPTFR